MTRTVDHGRGISLVMASPEKRAELEAAGVECRLCREPAAWPAISAFGFVLLCRQHADDAVAAEGDEMLTALRVSLRYGDDDSGGR